MAKAKEPVIETNPNFPVDGKFSGVARSVVCFNHNGWKNFRMVTLTVEDGKVVKAHYSDPFASFETIQKLELANDYTQLRLNACWADGKAWYLRKDKDGKDIQDGLSG